MLILLVSLSIVLLDQVSKYLVWKNLAFQARYPVFDGFFDVVHVHNTGAAWGMFAGQNAWLMILSFVVLFVMIFFRRYIMEDHISQQIAAGLITGGITGNLIDRLRLGYVVDFLDFYWGNAHFPAFNVADSSICVGAGLFLVSQFISASKERKKHAGENG